MTGADHRVRTIGGPSGPSVVYRRIRKRTPDELKQLPPVRTKSVEFKGTGLGDWGRWVPGLPLGEPPRDEDSLLDWALVSWARRRLVEEVWDFTGDHDGSP